jgi:hypothetical protein
MLSMKIAAHNHADEEASPDIRPRCIRASTGAFCLRTVGEGAVHAQRAIDWQYVLLALSR